jgi:type I restriction enzyme M protein
VAKAHARFLETLERWWQENLSLIEGLAADNGKKGNVYELRRQLLASIAETFAEQILLTDHQIRGAFARYMDDLKADLKSIAASGWGAELIPDDDILQSQFPELLAEMEQKRLRLAELTALFAAADEEDYEDSEDTGVLPSDEVKALRAELKEANAQAKLAKKEKRDPSEFIARRGSGAHRGFRGRSADRA